METTIQELIINRHFEMQPVIESCGIKQANYESLTKNLEKLGEDQLKALGDFIETLYLKKYLPYKRLYNSYTPIFWENLEATYGPSHLPEQRILRQQKREIKAFWIENIKGLKDAIKLA